VVVELETAKQLFYCKECDYQFTVTAGTIFNDSHLALQKWFLAVLLLCEAKKGMSASASLSARSGDSTTARTRRRGISVTASAQP
jgi:transposase-like protein